MFEFLFTLAGSDKVETLGSSGPEGQGKRAASVRSAWMPTEPLHFTGYGPGGVAGAGAKAGYPTGTGKESLHPLPAKMALSIQAPEAWGWPGSLQKAGQTSLHSDSSLSLEKNPGWGNSVSLCWL